MVGRYVHVPVDGIEYRTYFEENGEGIPLICLHTAGADSLEYRHLLADPEIAREFRVIAFDMPWHGRSLPPDGWWTEEYKLTRRFYTDFIVAFANALDVERPVLMGCSMGGYVMLDIAHDYPGRFGGLIALEPRAYEPAWAATSEFLVMPDVNPTNAIRPLVQSLCASDIPETYRREIEWIYAKCGPGVLSGDFHYAAESHDARPFLHEIDGAAEGLYLIGGDQDWSCYPEHTRELANAIDGAVEIRIPELGHFPPAEDPIKFKQVIMPVLDELKSRRSEHT